MSDIAIIGLSPEGVALGRALRSGLPGASVAGFDSDAAVAKRAVEAGALEDAPRSAATALAGAKLVIIGGPLLATRDALRVVGELAPSECVVTDTCRLKAPVLQWAQQHLPPGMHFVGGRPVLRGASEGTEPSFEGTDYAVVPGPTASSDAIEAVIGLAESVGASPFFLDPAEHDSFVIATEYLPRIAAGAAVDAASTSPAWRDAKRLQGDVFADAVDDARALDLEELAVALEYAPETLASWLDRLAGATSGLRAAALGRPDAAEAKKQLAALEEERRERLRESPAPGPRMEGMSFSSLLLGDWLSRRARRQG